MTIQLYIIIVIFVGLGLVAYFVFQHFYQKNVNTHDLYSEGLDMLVSGHIKDAYQNFKIVVQNDTNNIRAYLKLGQVAREGGNPKQALKIHKSLTIRKLPQSEWIELYKNLALDYYAIKDIGSAINISLQIINKDKKNEWALQNLVRLYREKQDWNKAVKYLTQYQKFTRKPDEKKIALYKIQEGRIELKSNNYEAARSIFRDVIKKNKEIETVYYFMGNSYASESEIAHRDAMGIQEAAANDSKINKKYKSTLADAHELLSKAVPNWKKFSEIEPKQSWLVIPKLKDALFTLDRYDEIESILKNILSKDPDNIIALAGLADFYRHRGDIEDAREVIDSAIAKDERSIISKLIHFKLNFINIEKSDAIAELDQIIDIVTSQNRPLSKIEDSDIYWLFEMSGDLEEFKA